jgi:hypothetical protein
MSLTLSPATLKTKSCIKVNQLHPIRGSRLDTKGTPVRDMKTVGMTLSKNQAIEMSSILLTMAMNHETIRITGHRDNNYITFLSPTETKIIPNT